MPSTRGPSPGGWPPEAYATWLSEVILQQTRVDTGTAYWHRFRGLPQRIRPRRCLAGRRHGPVEGPGLLQQGAQPARRGTPHRVRTERRPAPGFRGLARPSGIGPHTAAAISSICFSEPVPVIDGNVQRVLSRLFDVSDPVDRKAGKTALETAASELVHPDRPGDSNQAWMELGALVCKPKNPLCAQCPLADDCLARKNGSTSERPVKQAKKAAVEVQVLFDIRLHLAEDGTLLWWVERRPDTGIWGGLECFPVQMTEGHQTPSRLDLWGPVRHILTHRKMTAWFSFTLEPEASVSGSGQWIPVADGDRTWPRLIAKVLDGLQGQARFCAVEN